MSEFWKRTTRVIHHTNTRWYGVSQNRGYYCKADRSSVQSKCLKHTQSTSKHRTKRNRGWSYQWICVCANKDTRQTMQIWHWSKCKINAKQMRHVSVDISGKQASRSQFVNLRRILHPMHFNCIVSFVSTPTLECRKAVIDPYVFNTSTS